MVGDFIIRHFKFFDLNFGTDKGVIGKTLFIVKSFLANLVAGVGDFKFSN